MLHRDAFLSAFLLNIILVFTQKEHLYFAGFRQNVATGGNKVATEIPLIATRYSLIIKELSISVANVALS